jgi:hypothetical protein
MLRKFLERDHSLRLIRSNFIEIGISKYSCWLCERFMECLAKTESVQFVVSGFQGKMQSGWKLPPDPPYAQDTICMAELVTHETDEILEAVDRKRRSDHWATKRCTVTFCNLIVLFNSTQTIYNNRFLPKVWNRCHVWSIRKWLGKLDWCLFNRLGVI